MFYKSDFGILKDNYLLLYTQNSEMIVLDQITAIKINERTFDIVIFYNYFKSIVYDFIITLDNRQEIKFSLNKQNLDKAIEFKNRILHAKFSAQPSPKVLASPLS
jgi:hypothetical protein